MSLKSIGQFDVNRILRFNLDPILNWPIPPMLLKGLAGWFLAAFTIDVMRVQRGGFALFLTAASAGAFILPDLVRRMRAHRRQPLN